MKSLVFINKQTVKIMVLLFIGIAVTAISCQRDLLDKSHWIH